MLGKNFHRGKPFALLFFLVTASTNAYAADAERGAQLYQNHCIACHAESVHERSGPKAESVADIRYQITRWQNVLNLSWSEQEIDDVLLYLNNRFYQYPAAQ